MKLIDKSYMLLMCASALAAALALTACSADGDDDVRAGGDAMAYVSVSLSVAQPGGTRSPQGGNDGDGREPGVNHENDIDNVTLLLYRAENGGNAENAGDVKIEKAIYFPSLTSTTGGTYTSAPRECKIDISAGYHAIVVANMGDVSSVFQGQPLSSVRDHIVEKAWTEAADVSGYTGFAMASAEDATLSPTGNDGDGSEANPYVIHTSIERVAARIDIEPGDGEWDGGNLVERRQSERAEFYKNDEQEELFTTKTGWEFDLTLDMNRIFAPVTMDELVRRLDQREQTRLRKEAERRAKEGKRDNGQNNQQQSGSGLNMGGMGGLGGITGNMF